MVDADHPGLSIARQCELLSIARSSFYRTARGESEMNLTLMRLIDEQFLECPWYGSRQMARHLCRQGFSVGRKRIRRRADRCTTMLHVRTAISRRTAPAGA